MTADLQAQLAEKYHSEPWVGHSTMAENCWECEQIAALVSAHVAQVREGLAEEIEAHTCGEPDDCRSPFCDGLLDAARIVRPSVGPREQDGGS